MSVAIKIIHEVESAGAVVKIEGEQLKLIRGKLLFPSFLELVKANKAEVIEVLFVFPSPRDGNTNKGPGRS